MRLKPIGNEALADCPAKAEEFNGTNGKWNVRGIPRIGTVGSN